MTFTKKLLVLAKGMVEQLEEQNESLIETTKKKTIGVVVVNQLFFIVVARFGRGSKEPWSDSRKVGCASRGNERFKVKDITRKPLSLSNGGI